MNDKVLKELRELSKIMLSKRIKLLMVTTLLMVAALILLAYTYPEKIAAVFGLLLFCFGLTFGAVFDAAEYYNIFWNKLKTSWEKKHDETN